MSSHVVSNIESSKDNRLVQQFIRILIFFIPIIITLTIGIAWWQYPEKYEFFQEFVSYLGGIKSQLGFDNQISSLIMIIGFVSISIISLTIAIIYFLKSNLKYNISKAVFALFLTIGAAGIAIPHDQPNLHIVHGIGAFMFILGFTIFNFIAQVLRFIKRKKRINYRKAGLIMDFTVSLVVIFALVLFILFYILERVASGSVPSYLAELSQKIVLMVDCIAVFFLDNRDM
ncbi:MAG: hypothetical protein JXA54_08380 [Candidatus Heimdallarchaeota archaeon]|nr:hypothetical protein [Candidatus Heimdallarchaeota archaeon]